MSYWAVAQTEPLRERLAVDELEQIGFDVYCPRIRFRYNRRWRTAALFPSYIFVRIAFPNGWWKARWCRGIVRLLGPDGCEPHNLSENIIVEIKARERDGFVVLKSLPKLNRGQQIRIIGGRFDGQLALFEGQTRHDRIKVLMQMLGSFAVVELGQYDKVELPEPPNVVAIVRKSHY